MKSYSASMPHIQFLFLEEATVHTGKERRQTGIHGDLVFFKKRTSCLLFGRTFPAYVTIQM